MTTFVQLNQGWNADPNAPEPTVLVDGSTVLVSFGVNAFQFAQFAEGDRAVLRFEDCQRYRLGATNDEGWYSGKCRFSRLAPAWGEFFHVSGDSSLLLEPSDWVFVAPSSMDEPHQHYLFYFKDGTFECVASKWAVQLPASLSIEPTRIGRPQISAQLQR